MGHHEAGQTVDESVGLREVDGHVGWRLGSCCYTARGVVVCAELLRVT